MVVVPPMPLEMLLSKSTLKAFDCFTQMVPPFADAMSIFPSPLKSPGPVKTSVPQLPADTVEVAHVKELPVEKHTLILPPFAVAISVFPSPLKSAAHV